MALKLLEKGYPPIRTPMGKASPGRASPGKVDPMAPVWQRWFTSVPEWLFQKPSCHVWRSSALTVTTSTETDVIFGNEDHDNADMHHPTTARDRITIPQTGVYMVGAHLRWEANATGQRRLRLTLNDAAPATAANSLMIDNPLAASFNGNAPTSRVATTRKFTAGTSSGLRRFRTRAATLT